MTEPTLNERAAKAIGARLLDCGECRYDKDGAVRRFDPTHFIDDARLVVDKAIEVGGWDAYFYSLLEVTGVLHVSNVTKIYKAITLAAAEQETRAALAVIEAKGGNDGMG